MNTTQTIERSAPADSHDALVPYLRPLFSPALELDLEQDFELLEGDNMIGRELPDGNGIVIRDPGISRCHATLYAKADGAMYVRDEGSKNGTYRNGRRLSASARLRDGDVLRLGDTLLLLRYEPRSQADPALPGLLGTAPPMGRLRSLLRRLGADPVSVMLLGETGTGKELVARALHELSGRSGAFIAVNCAAVPESLAESLFFGHLGGSFTGAIPQPGYFRAADRGTLFLDEIGELSLPIQSKLLRTLEERAVIPVGALRPMACDVRVVSATNRPIARMIAAGSFRSDLQARLRGILLTLPGLAQRREDILPLLKHSLTKLGAAQLATSPTLTPDLVELLLTYGWPLNVREIHHFAKHLQIKGADEELFAQLRANPVSDTDAVGSPSRASDDDDESDEAEGEKPPDEPRRPLRHVPLPPRDRLIALLEKNNGIVKYIAEELNCSRRQVGRMLKEYQIDPQDYRI